MSSIGINIYFFDIKPFASPEELTSLLEALSSVFVVSSMEVGPRDGPSIVHTPNARSNQFLDAAIHAHMMKRLLTILKHESSDYTFRLIFDWVDLTEGNDIKSRPFLIHIDVGLGQDLVLADPNFKPRADLLELLPILGKTLYRHVAPYYGAIDIGPGLETFPSRVEFANSKFKELQWISFFGPEFVKNIGPERFKMLPGNSVTIMPDGGRLVQLSSDKLLLNNSDIATATTKLFGST